jgi:hypothetical protein
MTPLPGLSPITASAELIYIKTPITEPNLLAHALVAAFAVFLCWWGVRMASRALVNLGIVGFAIAVGWFYFSDIYNDHGAPLSGSSASAFSSLPEDGRWKRCEGAFWPRMDAAPDPSHHSPRGLTEREARMKLGPKLCSVALLVIQLAIVSTIAAKYLYQRWSCPRVWTRAVAIDPQLPMRGRYLSLQLDGGWLPKHAALGQSRQRFRATSTARLFKAPIRLRSNDVTSMPT